MARTDQKGKGELLRHWEDLVRLIYPAGARIRSMEEKTGYRITVAWRMGDPGNYTENWSREVDIVIPRETIEAYRNKSDHERRIADENLVSLIRLKKTEFKAGHDVPRYHVPPVEEWRVGPEDMAPPRPGPSTEE